MVELTGGVETPRDFGTGDAAKVDRWLMELDLAGKAQSKWEMRAAAVIKRYRDERPVDQTTGRKKRRFNVLWSNIQTRAPALYSRLPIPDVRRRHRDRDPVGRMSSEILERCLLTEAELVDLDSHLRATVLDYELTGRGVVWARYMPEFEDERIDLFESEGGFVDGDNRPADEELENETDESGQLFQMRQNVVEEHVRFEHVYYKDFLHSPAKSWFEVRWVGKLVLMNRDALIERFGRAIGNAIELTEAPSTRDERIDTHKEVFKQAPIWEIWDKPSGKAIWISKSFKLGPLDEQDDPLGLTNFFPCPRPLFANMTNDTLEPIPDYAQYQDQAQELDTLTERISLITKSLKVIGWYAGDAKDVIGGAINSNQENLLLPVPEWAVFAERGGIEGNIAWLPLETIAVALGRLLEAREVVKRDLFEISGMSDIIRGETEPNETATAQQIKAQFGSMRLRDRQAEVARFARDCYRIAAEVISEQFDPKTISDMSGFPDIPERPPAMQTPEQFQAFQAMVMEKQQQFQQALELLSRDKLRAFRIGIETDSTVALDDTVEKERRNEFLSVVGGFLERAVPAVLEAPILAGVVADLMLFTVRGYKAGRQLESSFEELAEELKAAAEEGQGGDGQAEAQFAEQEAAAAQAEMQADQALRAAQLQGDQELAGQKVQGDLAIKGAKVEGELRIKAGTAQANAEIRGQEAANNARIKAAVAQVAAALTRETRTEGNA